MKVTQLWTGAGFKLRTLLKPPDLVQTPGRSQPGHLYPEPQETLGTMVLKSAHPAPLPFWACDTDAER